MAARDIRPADWPQALERLAREHRGWLATVERDGRVEVRDAPLHSIEAGRGIDLRLGDTVVHVDAPRAVRIEETEEGAAAALELYEGVGSTVTLRFRISEPLGALDGLAPAER